MVLLQLMDCLGWFDRVRFFPGSLLWDSLLRLNVRVHSFGLPCLPSLVQVRSFGLWLVYVDSFGLVE